MRRWLGPLVLAGLAGAVPLVLENQFYVLLLELVGIFYIAALGLNLVLGYAGQVSLGHAALFGVGAYASAIVTLKLQQPFVVGLLAGIVLAALVGVVLGLPSLRMAGAYLAMATMAFNLILQRLAVNWADLTGGPDGLVGIPPAALGPLVFDRRTHLYLVLALALLAYLVTRRLVASRYGRGWMAIRDDELAAGCLGVDLYGNKLLAFVLSAVYAAVAGSLFAHLYRHISPASFGLETSIDLLLMVILGGLGTTGWPLAGALVLTVLPQLPALQALQDLRLLVFGGLLLLAVLSFRRGLAGLWTALARRGRPRLALGATARHDSQRGPALRLPPGMAQQPAGLVLQAVSRRFGGTTALDSVDLVVEPGSIHGLIGPNGSGKTTLINLVTGVLRPGSGRMLLDGRDIAGLPPHRLAAQGVGRTFQNVRLFAELSVIDNVLVGAHAWLRPALLSVLLGLPSARRAEAVATALARSIAAGLGLTAALDALPGSLSHGWQRRVELARALALRPRLLLLDEPAAGLAREEVDELRQLILALRQQGVTVLLVEHRLELVMSVCDVVTVLDSGRVIASGPPSSIQADPRVQEAYLGQGSAAFAAR